MSLWRKDARRDANEPLLVRDLRKAGVYWRYAGPLDGWAGRAGVWLPVEVKDPAKSPSKRKLTDAEQDFIRDAQAYGLPYCVALTVEDVIRALGTVR